MKSQRVLAGVPAAPMAWLLLSLVLGSTAAQAESLAEAWSVSQKSDPMLQSFQLGVEAAEEDLAAAKAQRLPLLSASGSVMKLDETPAFNFGAAGIPVELPLYTGSSVWMSDATVSLPLFTSGALANAIEAAESGLGSQRYQAEAAAMDTRLAVAEAYINVLRAQSGLTVAESHVISLSSHARDVEDMFAAGQVPRNDFLSASVALADAQQRQLQARNQLDIARAHYNRRLNRGLTAEVELDETLPVAELPLHGMDLEQLSLLAMERRPEIAGLDQGGSALRSQARATRARTLPQLALTGGYTFLENQFLNQEDFWMVGVGFRWALFDSGRTRHEVNALSRRARAMEHRKADLQSMIALQVRQSYLQVEEAGLRVTVTQKAVEQAEENLRVVRDRYKNGEGTNTEVLDAESLRNLSRANYDNARFDAELSRIRLARAAGLL